MITIVIKQYLRPGENWSLWVSNWMWIKRPRVSLLTTRSVLNLSYKYIWNELININWFGGFVSLFWSIFHFFITTQKWKSVKKNKSKIKYDHFILTFYDVQNNMPSRNTRKQQRETSVSNTRLLKVSVFGELFLPGQVTMTTESITYSVRGYVQSFGVKLFGGVLAYSMFSVCYRFSVAGLHATCWAVSY